MRLICPNCGAAYDVGEGVLPAGGSHVQCSACHTRWFARPAAPPAQAPSEDQIIARLETRERRPRSPGPVASPEPPAVAPAPDPEPPAGAEPVTLAPAPATPLRPRVVPDRPPLAAPPPVAEPPARRRRFPLGFGLALALAAVAAGAYLFAQDLAARAPAAGPALAGYAGRIDAARDGVEARLGSLRDRIAGDGEGDE